LVFAFDTLSYARFLREHGVSQEHAEAHAEAARQYIMAELVTKQDLLLVRQDLLQVREEMATKQDLKLIRQELESLATRFQLKLDHLSAHFDTKLDNLSLRLTVRLGVLLAAGIAALAALIKLG
jgi:hypothetical protein